MLKTVGSSWYKCNNFRIGVVVGENPDTMNRTSYIGVASSKASTVLEDEYHVLKTGAPFPLGEASRLIWGENNE